VVFLIDFVDNSFDARIALDQDSFCCLYHVELEKDEWRRLSMAEVEWMSFASSSMCVKVR